MVFSPVEGVRDVVQQRWPVVLLSLEQTVLIVDGGVPLEEVHHHRNRCESHHVWVHRGALTLSWECRHREVGYVPGTINSVRVKEVFKLLSCWNLVGACLRLDSLLHPHHLVLVNGCPSIFRRHMSSSLLFFNVLGHLPVLLIHACVVNHRVLLGSLFILILAWFFVVYFISRIILRILVLSSIGFGGLLSLQHFLVLLSLCLPFLLQSSIIRYFLFLLRKIFVRSFLL